MQYFCQLHSLPYSKVCLQPECNRKGPLCTMCVQSHDQHNIKELNTFLNEQVIQLSMDLQSNIMNKLEDLKKYFHSAISKQQIDLNSIDQNRKKVLVSQLQNDKMNSTLFSSKLVELIQRDQLKEQDYLQEYMQVLNHVEISVKSLLNQFPSRSQPNIVEIRDISPPLSSRSKEPIFQHKEQSISPLRKQLMQRDLSQVGSFNNSKAKNYFTEQDSQRSARSKLDQQGQKSTRPFEMDRSYEKIIDYNKSNKSFLNEESNNQNNKSFHNDDSYNNTKSFHNNDFNNNNNSNINKHNRSFHNDNNKSLHNNDQNNTSNNNKSFHNNDSNISIQNNEAGKNNTSQFFYNEQNNKSLFKNIPLKQQSNYISLPQQQQQLSQIKQTNTIMFNDDKNQNITIMDQYPQQPQQSMSFSNTKTDPQQSIIKQSPMKQSNFYTEPPQNNQNEGSLKKSVQSNSSQLMNQSNLDLSYISQRSSAPPQIRKIENLKNPLVIVRLQPWKAHDRSVKDLALMDEDKLISCSKDKLIKIWDKRTKQLKITLKDHLDQVLSVAFSKKRIIVSGSADRTVRIWKPQPQWKLAHICSGHTDRVRCVGFVENYVVSGSDDTTLRIWDLEGKEVHCLKTQGRISALAVEQKNVVFGAGKNLMIFDGWLLEQKFEKKAHDNLILCLALQTDQNGAGVLISGGKDNFVKIWSYPDLEILREMPEDYSVNSVCLNPKTQYLYVGLMGNEQEGKISIWRIDSNTEKVQEIYDNSYGCNRVLFDGQLLFSAHENRRIEAFTLEQQ